MGRQAIQPRSTGETHQKVPLREQQHQQNNTMEAKENQDQCGQRKREMIKIKMWQSRLRQFILYLWLPCGHMYILFAIPMTPSRCALSLSPNLPKTTSAQAPAASIYIRRV